MRGRWAVLGLVAGMMLGAFASCDAPTFYCVSLEVPETDPPGPGDGCYCKVGGDYCGNMGECMRGCP